MTEKTVRAVAARRPRAPWDVRTLRPLPGEFNLTIEDAADELHISRQAVHRLVERGTLDARRVGRKPVILVREKDVKALPMSPQRRRELILRGELAEAELVPASAELGDELPEG